MAFLKERYGLCSQLTSTLSDSLSDGSIFVIHGGLLELHWTIFPNKAI